MGKFSEFKVDVEINGTPLQMELDTGPEATVAAKQLWTQLGCSKLKTAPRLRAYGGANLAVIGQCDVEVRLRGQLRQLPIVFLEDEEAVPLFGLPWIRAFDAVRIQSVSWAPGLLKLLKEYYELIDASTIGTVRGYKAHLYFKPDAQFRINKQWPLPHALKPRVEAKLQRLVSIGVLTPVDIAEYATTPFVAVPKPNGAIRICGDFKVSLNSQLNVQRYPLPTVAEVLHTAAGGTRFSKLDLADAYLQVELDEESGTYVVLTTHRGFFQVNRLAFELAAAPAIFQSIIEQILRPVDHTQPYLDNVLVTGTSTERHLKNLQKCFERLRNAGIRLKREKCSFFQAEIEHLGHVISESEVRPSPRNARAILEAPAPTDLKSFESWLCTAQYYQPFIEKFSSIAGPLNELRKKGAEFL